MSHSVFSRAASSSPPSSSSAASAPAAPTSSASSSEDQLRLDSLNSLRMKAREYELKLQQRSPSSPQPPMVEGKKEGEEEKSGEK